MSRIPPLRILPTSQPGFAPDASPFLMPDAIDQWLETAFDPSVDGDDLAAPLCGSCRARREDDE